jgi:hypothetical protein
MSPDVFITDREFNPAASNSRLTVSADDITGANTSSMTVNILNM